MSDNIKKIVNSALLAALAVGVVAASSPLMAADKGEKESMEKCYGIAKAGKNDCGSINHACASHGTKDGDANEWVYVPKGACDKIVGGKTK